MAYHIMISNDPAGYALTLDRYLGSATTVDYYWESVGRKLGLPIISQLTERADSEEGLSLSGESLIALQIEIEEFERYWNDESSNTDLPKGLLETIQAIKHGIHAGIANNSTLTIG